MTSYFANIVGLVDEKEKSCYKTELAVHCAVEFQKGRMNRLIAGLNSLHNKAIDCTIQKETEKNEFVLLLSVGHIYTKSDKNTKQNLVNILQKSYGEAVFKMGAFQRGLTCGILEQNDNLGSATNAYQIKSLQILNDEFRLKIIEEDIIKKECINDLGFFEKLGKSKNANFSFQNQNNQTEILQYTGETIYNTLIKHEYFKDDLAMQYLLKTKYEEAAKLFDEEMSKTNHNHLNFK